MRVKKADRDKTQSDNRIRSWRGRQIADVEYRLIIAALISEREKAIVEAFAAAAPYMPHGVADVLLRRFLKPPNKQ